MTDTILKMVQLIDQNFSLHASKIPSLTSGMQVFESPNLLYTDSGLSCDTFNIIHITNGANLTIEALRMAVQHFKEKKLEYCIWINQENLLPAQPLFNQLGLAQQNEEVGMVLNLDQYNLIEKETDKNIKIVNDHSSLEHFASAIAANWTPPDANILKYYSETAAQFLDKTNNIKLLLYYHEAIPVSTIELFPTNKEIVGIYGFTTLQTHRRMGIGSSMMTFALNLCKKLGYEKVILQATNDGIGIYQKYGFEPFTVYYEYA